MGHMKELAIEQANIELEELYSGYAMEQNVLENEKHQAFYEAHRIQLIKDNQNE